MSAKKHSNHFLVQGSILAAASLIVRLIGLLYRIPLNRIVGHEGMGIYSYAFDLYNLALILSSYSLPLAVSKLVAARTAFKEHRNSYRIFLCAMVFAITIGLAAPEGSSAASSSCAYHSGVFHNGGFQGILSG